MFSDYIPIARIYRTGKLYGDYDSDPEVSIDLEYNKSLLECILEHDNLNGDINEYKCMYQDKLLDYISNQINNEEKMEQLLNDLYEEEKITINDIIADNNINISYDTYMLIIKNTLNTGKYYLNYFLYKLSKLYHNYIQNEYNQFNLFYNILTNKKDLHENLTITEEELLSLFGFNNNDKINIDTKQNLINIYNHIKENKENSNIMLIRIWLGYIILNTELNKELITYLKYKIHVNNKDYLSFDVTKLNIKYFYTNQYYIDTDIDHNDGCIYYEGESLKFKIDTPKDFRL